MPVHRTSRTSLAWAGMGALLTVLAWAGWSALGSIEPTAAAARAPATDAPAPARLATTVPAPSRDVVPAASAAVAQGADRPQPAARALPVVPDGFVMEHGLLTAVRAPVATVDAPIAPMALTLPAGVRIEDARVSRTGMVAVMHTAAAPADVAPNPPRPAMATNSH
jgi:hypothetical protein